MNLPPTITESEALDAIEKAVAVLTPKFRKSFGPSISTDDVAQQIRLFGWELLNSGKYDPSKSLDGWVYVHCRNRCCNWKRTLVTRSDAPCEQCHSGWPCGPDGQFCKAYAGWHTRNRTKANLMRGADIDHVRDESERTMREPSKVVEEAELNELLQIIDEELPVEMRAELLKMRAGLYVPTDRRERVTKAVLEILRAEGVTLAV